MATASFKLANTATRFRTARPGFIAFGRSSRKRRGLHRRNTARLGRCSPRLLHVLDGRSHESLVFIWWFALGFSVEVEGGLSAAARTFVGKFGRPIAGHPHLDLGA